VLAGAGVGGLAKRVAIETIPAYQRGAVTVVPFRWLATGPVGGAFPVLDANLELAAEGSNTVLTIVGSHLPPFGKLGAAADSLLLKTVARATIRSFLGRMGELAEQPVPGRVHQALPGYDPKPEQA
jgi:hypothetical protein